MSDQLNRVKFTSATTGTGASVAFGAVYSAAFFSPTEAGAVDGRRYSYVIQQGNDIEIQQDQVWTAAGATIARGTPAYSKIGGVAGTTKITLDSTQIVSFGASALDLVFHNTHGGDIASATTTNLDTATGEAVDVTGTTTITGITLAEGQTRTVRFTGALTLTHGASLVLPGAVNIATVAGDYAIFRGYASGVVRCVGYFTTTVHGATSKAAPVDADELGLYDSEDSFRLKKLTWANHKAALKTYDDNIAINGAVDVSQELGTTGATLVNNTAKYIADCWEAMYNHGAATAVVTSAQLAAASFPAALAGFAFGHQIKATTAITAPASGDFAKHRTKIEGYRIAHLGWGAAGAAAIVVAFQLYSTASGTAFVKLSNSDQSRCYYHEITVAAGWNFYAFNVPGDTSGTWQATTSTGLTVELFVAGQAATPASSLDAWGATNSTQTTNSTNLLASNNNQTVVTGLFIAAGTQLPVAANLPLLMRPAGDELTKCQYFYRRFTGVYNIFLPGTCDNATSGIAALLLYPEMRASPSLATSAVSNFIVRFPTGTAFLTGLTLSGFNNGYGFFSWTVASGGVAGDAMIFGQNANATLALDARL